MAARRSASDRPLQIVISVGSQRLWVYDKNGLLRPRSSRRGRRHPTPMGVFAVIDKEVTHYFNIYGGASLPFMQRLTMSGVAMHRAWSPATRPRTVASSPVRHQALQAHQARRARGHRPQRAGSSEITHARLFVRSPFRREPIDPGGAKGIVIVIATDMTAAVANAKVGKITAERAVELQKLPISVLVSKADGKVIVRHGFRQVYEAPAVIRDPDRPLGTHVYTALEFKDGAMRCVGRRCRCPHPVKASPVHVVSALAQRG